MPVKPEADSGSKNPTITEVDMGVNNGKKISLINCRVSEINRVG
jgi:hypothetical protein